jgi:hypothetical protein
MEHIIPDSGIFTCKAIRAGNMNEINAFMGDLWIEQKYPSIFITHQDIFVSIWNGTEPLSRYSADPGHYKEQRIKDIINAGFQTQRFISGILCVDKYCKPNQMYFICPSDDSPNYNGVLSWDRWEAPITEMQALKNRVSALESITKQ